MERVLGIFKHNVVQLIQREAELQRANARLDAALGNMSQGLCMYDCDERLVMVNPRYCEIFGVPMDKIRLGCTRRKVIELCASYGHIGDLAVDKILERSAARMQGLEAGAWAVEASGGRTIEVSQRPTADAGLVTTFDDVIERHRAEQQIVFLARHDALTGLPNRTLFQERVEQELAHVGRGTVAAMLCLDLDRFKEVNDTLGHLIGDMLLRSVAARLQAAVREVNMVARLGGGEFAVIQVGLERPEDAERLAQRIMDLLGAAHELDGHSVTVGISIGVAVAPADGTHFDKLLKCADLALYCAKLGGQGGFRFFEQGMDAQLQARRALEQDMRHALAEGKFELFYQPLVNLERGAISCFEALMRWRHPVRGLVNPAEFIPVAEMSGLIVPLGEWALHRACAEAASWPGNVSVAVNLSPVQFKGRALVQTVTEALAASGLPDFRLELEITESVLLQDGKATLQALRDLGVRIAMDDFGTGYSSLSYLRSFPFDKIKIDQSFIHDLRENDNSAAIVRAVTSLGTSLGMATTAEGIETHAQLAQLRMQCCTEVQGYLFSRPCPAGDMAMLLQRSRLAGWLEATMAGLVAKMAG
jgi:diguanylate cyclase (GGDEF)-like protein